MHFFPNFRRTLRMGTLKRVNKETMCCLVGFPEEFIAVLQVKMFQIDTENDKKHIFPVFQSFYAFSLKFPRGLECFKG